MDPAEELDNYLKGKGSPMVGQGATLVAAGKKYGVDPKLVVAISGAESSFGKYRSGPYNAWGWGPGIPFNSWQEGISTVTKGLRSGYLDQGLRTPQQIVNKYAPASDGNDTGVWSGNVSSFLHEMGANPLLAGPKTQFSSTPISLDQPPELGTPALDALIMSNAGRDPTTQMRNLVEGLMAGADQPPKLKLPKQPDYAMPVPTGGPGPRGSGRALLAAGADRAGVPIHPQVVNFVKQISGTFGKPLTITTGTNHNQFVINTNRQSAHWTGWAADIMYGHGSPGHVDPALTALGRAALITAGMPRAQANRQNGGLYNVGPYQVIFNSTEGGNHYNHLHVGLAANAGTHWHRG